MNKNFDDFLSTINAEKLLEDVNKNHKFAFNLDSDGMMKYSAEILKISTLQSIKLLELYHNWLNSDTHN